MQELADMDTEVVFSTIDEIMGNWKRDWQNAC